MRVSFSGRMAASQAANGSSILPTRTAAKTPRQFVWVSLLLGKEGESNWPERCRASMRGREAGPAEIYERRRVNYLWLRRPTCSALHKQSKCLIICLGYFFNAWEVGKIESKWRIFEGNWRDLTLYDKMVKQQEIKEIIKA